MEEKLVKYLEEMGMNFRDKPLLLAVSGGRDSMTLATLFLKAKLPFEIAHFNFQLRGKASELDEKFVADFAKKNNLVFHLKREDTERYAKQHKIGIQEAARDLRYEWFDQLLKERKMDFVATAHHKDDAVETMLFNFIRGGGISGLKGISKKRKNIIRPLLFATQEEINRYAEKNNVKFRQDESNNSTKYSRNKIRHTIVPELKKINPSLVETLSRTAKIYNQGALINDQVIDKELKNVLIIEDDVQKFPLTHLRSSKYKNLLLWQWIKPFGFASKQVEEALELLESNSGKKIASKHYELLRDRDYFILFPSKKAAKTNLAFNRLEELSSSPLFEVKKIKPKEVNFTNDNRIAYFDLEKIKFPIQLRNWEPGDYFLPLGMGGKKQKISDLLIQKKVSIQDKKSVLIMSFGGEIAWILGYHTSESFRVRGDSEVVVEIKIRK